MSELPRMEAMELVQQPNPFDYEDWFYEIKYDGFRGLAYIEKNPDYSQAEGRREMFNKRR